MLRVFLASSLLLAAQSQLPPAASGGVDYFKDVKPLLAQNCYSCHAEAKQKGDALFEGLVVNRMSESDHKDFLQLLGIEPRPAAKPPVDPKKPLSETTGDQVAAAIGKPGAKGNEHLALALPYNPIRPRANSAELKRFLEGRKRPRSV